jgi:hypothetical protein
MYDSAVSGANGGALFLHGPYVRGAAHAGTVIGRWGRMMIVSTPMYGRVSGTPGMGRREGRS